MVNVVAFGAASPFCLAILQEMAPQIKHAFIQSKSIQEVQRVLLQTQLSCPVEIVEGDFTEPKEDFFSDCQERLRRLPSIDLILWSVGLWSPHTNLEHGCLSSHFTQWQGNFFTPLALFKILVELSQKQTLFLYNNSDKALKNKALHSLTLPSLHAQSDFIETAAIEKKWRLIKANLPLYRSLTSGNVFTSLPELSDCLLTPIKKSLSEVFPANNY